MRARPLGRALLVTMLLLDGLWRAAQADQITVEVAADQRVTAFGRSVSLKTVLEDICFRAGAELLYFDASDRAFGGEYREIPLKALIARLLQDDSYLVQTVGNAEAGTERVTTLRVLGDPATGSARRAKGGGSRKNWQVPPVLLETAFGTGAQDAAERDTAIATMATRISSDPAQLQGFLSTDARLIAEAIRRYKGVEGPLRALQKRYPDPRISTKIDEIISALGRP